MSLVTVPAVPPVVWTVRTWVRVKMAFTEWGAPMVSEHVIPVQSPDQPMKAEVASGVAVSVTVVPMSKLAEQVPAPPTQLIREGALVIVPDPSPDGSNPTVRFSASSKSADTDVGGVHRDGARGRRIRGGAVVAPMGEHI